MEKFLKRSSRSLCFVTLKECLFAVKPGGLRVVMLDHSLCLGSLGLFRGSGVWWVILFDHRVIWPLCKGFGWFLGVGG